MRTIILLLLSFSLYSQGIIKKYNNQYELIREVEKIPFNPKYQSKFNIRFIYLGKKSYKLTNEKIILLKDRINRTFKESNITFTYDSNIYSYYNDLNIDSCYNLVDREIDRKTYNHKDINFYIVERCGKTYNGLSSYPISKYNRIFVDLEKIDDGTVEHELGHYFGLLHTFENTIYVNEHNADNDGDMISDTRTDNYDISFDEKKCLIFGDWYDNTGFKFNPDITNYMSYYGKCRDKFSPKQILRMNKIATYRKLYLKN